MHGMATITASQLAVILEQEWEPLPPGTPLPTRAELVERFEVPESRVDSARQLLKARGLVSGGQGKVWRRAGRVVLPIHVLRSAARCAEGQLPTDGADAFVGDVESLGFEVSEELAVHHLPGEVLRDMLRRVNGEPHNLARWWFPNRVAEGTALWEDQTIVGGSIPYLAKIGQTPDKYVVRMRARIASEAEATRLEIPREGRPVLVEIREAYLRGAEVFRSETVWPDTELILELEP